MKSTLNINKNYRDCISQWQENKVLGINLLDTKDLFLLATALGLNSPKEMKDARDSYVRTSYIKTYDKALLGAIMLGLPQNIDKVDMYAKEEVCYEEAEYCAESGFLELKKLIEGCQGNQELLEKRVMYNLELLYQKNVAIEK